MNSRQEFKAFQLYENGLEAANHNALIPAKSKLGHRSSRVIRKNTCKLKKSPGTETRSRCYRSCSCCDAPSGSRPSGSGPSGARCCRSRCSTTSWTRDPPRSRSHVPGLEVQMKGHLSTYYN